MKSLRERALELLETNQNVNLESSDIKEIIHELNVNQIELEIQNQELREKEEILIQTKEELTNLFMDAPIAYIVLDKNYYILKYNKKALNIFKFKNTNSEKYFISFFKEMKLFQSFLDWITKNDESYFETTIKTTDKSFKYVKFTHKITTINNTKNHLLSVVDITKEKEEKEKLHVYGSILEKLPVSVIITNKEGYITYVNNEVVNNTGYQIDELIGLRPSVFNSNQTLENEDNQLWETISKGNTWKGLLKNLTKSKEYRWMATAISPILDESNKITHYIAVETNIDEKIRMEEELKTQEDVMLIQARHAAMGEMISLIAHQWRQPLSVISTIATGIKIQKEFGIQSLEEELKNLDAINESAQYLSETINDFKDFFKNNKVLEKTNGNKIIEKIKKLNSEIFKTNNIKFLVNITSNSNIYTYENELLQVLINLINNSSDAILEKKDTISNPVISINIYTNNKNLIIEINDNAGGIPNEIIKKIFDPYFTTKGPTSGTGLGLYITKTIIDKHLKGSISVQNNIHGALFKISIPNLNNAYCQDIGDKLK